jgi:hypothetical protein
MRVEFIVEMPEAVAAKLREQSPDLGRLGLEKVVCSLYREEQLSQIEAMRALDCPSRLAFEELLTRHNLHRDWSREEISQEFAAVDRLHSRE